MKKSLLFEKPQGVRDFLPETAANKKQIESEITNCFDHWGYQEIITPMFEYMDTFQTGLRGTEDKVFKFVERSGKTVALRPDMTTPIARVAASLLKQVPLPIRLAYTANIFRQQEDLAGRDTEFTQAGVELIGEPAPDGDAEMLALAVTTLQAIGIEGFRIALGQVGFLHGLLDEYVSEESLRERLLNALVDKDYVAYEQLVTTETETAAQSVLLQIPRLRGSVEILAKAKELTHNVQALDALQNLSDIWQVLQIHGVTEYIQIDLSLLLGLNYYTGAIFEGYAPMMGFPICGGGRYDDLIEKFGRMAPATGFIIGIERVLEILEKRGAFTPKDRYLICYSTLDREYALRFAAFLRNRNLRVSTLQVAAGDKMVSQEGCETLLVRDGNLQTKNDQIQELYQGFLATKGGEKE